MENFKTISIKDKNLFEKYLLNIPNKSYEYSFITLYLWRNLCNTKFSIINDCLIIRKELNDDTFFMMPLGYDSSKLQDLIIKLKKLSPDNNIYLFGDIEENFINDIKNYTNLPFELIDEKDTFEYIYLTNDLLQLKGKKYHKKRNHYNTFVSSYNYSIEVIDNEEIINDCIHLVNDWHKNRVICCKELLFETSAINDLLHNLNYLNLKSIAIYINGILAGFSIGEIFRDTAIIHIERCDIKYKGIYSFINNEFIKKDFSETKYINRQEDCGCPGLRKSKLSYYPVYLLRKSLIKI